MFNPTLFLANAIVRRKCLWGTLPEGCLKDMYCAQAAQIACCVSGKHKKFDLFIRELSRTGMNLSMEIFMDTVFRSFALGFTEKWR